MKSVKMLSMHINFIKNVSLKLANNLQDTFFERINELQYSPFKYPFLNEINIKINTFRKINICKYYLIIYTVIEDIVYINAIVDGRQNYLKFLD